MDAHGLLQAVAAHAGPARGEEVRSQTIPEGLLEAMGKFVDEGHGSVHVESEEQARQVAHEFMELHRVHWPEFVGECEVRPFEDM